MKNRQKGFIIPLIIVLIAVLGIGAGAYVYLNKNKTIEPIQTNEGSKPSPTLKKVNDNSTTSTKDIQNDKNTNALKINSTITKSVSTSNKNSLSYTIVGSTLKMYWNGELAQTLSLEPEGLRTWTWAKNKYSTSAPSPFITNKDVNFDGYNDVGMIGMGGYDNKDYTWSFYIFNPSTKKLEPSELVNEHDIHIPTVDATKKQIIVPMANGYYDTYQWTGSEFFYVCPSYSLWAGSLTKDFGGFVCSMSKETINSQLPQFMLRNP